MRDRRTDFEGEKRGREIERNSQHLERESEND